MTYRYKIGIDPGIKCGVSKWDSKEGNFQFVSSTKLYDLFTILYVNCDNKSDTIVYIENPNTWVPFNGGRAVDSSRLQGAGAVKQTFKHIVEFLEDRKIPYHTTRLQGGLKKKTSAWFRMQTKWHSPTDEHGRDAALLVWKR